MPTETENIALIAAALRRGGFDAAAEAIEAQAKELAEAADSAATP